MTTKINQPDRVMNPDGKRSISALRPQFFWLLFFLVLLAGGLNQGVINPVSARSNQQAISIIEPDVREFPVIRVTFKAVDPNQIPITNLTTSQVKVVENGQIIDVDNLVETYSGTHTILAINADTSLDKRDASGISIYEKLIERILQWQSSIEIKDEDVWSLTLNQDRQYLRLTDNQTWLSAIRNYQPDMRNSENNLTGLTAAINNAALGATEMNQVLIYITPEPQAEDAQLLSSLTQQAADKGLIVHIWMVGETYSLDTDRGRVLTNLALQTGGSIFSFSGKETIPDPQGYFSKLGSIYSLSYTSRIAATGTYSFQVSVNLDGTVTTSPDLTFYVEVLPPNPIFISPPMVIESHVQNLEVEPGNLPEPREQKINIQIEFPDGHPRTYKYVRLYADGVLVQENTSAPFETFVWDYSSITVDTTSILQVKLEDILGIQVDSAEIPVMVDVIEPAAQPLLPETWLSKWLVPVLVSTAALAGLAISVITAIRKRNPGKSCSKAPMLNLQRKSLRNKRKNAESTRPASFAVLVRLNADGTPSQVEPIHLSEPLSIFGSNPSLANVRLADPSVESTHASLRQMYNGKFFLAELSTGAGTWVNDSPVSEAGNPLEDGDHIRIGEVNFIFKVSYTDPKKSKPKEIV